MKEYHFTVPGKEKEDEPIIIYTHRHIASFVKEIFITIVLAFLPIIFMSIYSNSNIVLSSETLTIIIITSAIYYLSIATYTFLEWITYYYDILIVTERTLIDIEQNTFFSRHISHLHLRQIEDISSDIKGILPTILNYGNVVIQTAGANDFTIIKNTPNPQRTASIILDLHKKIIDEQGPLPKT